ncbi:MAG: twin-arginine translocase TatA/TatE family subunit [Bacteroidales bacterium]|nr:MAG: twin-arginine translocase TatA/TatE family subunit [Bacteroidales bacterium]
MKAFILAGAVGITEIVLILVVVLLFFGGRKIPELMRGLGQGVSEFKKGMREGDQTTSNEAKKDTKDQKE